VLYALLGCTALVLWRQPLFMLALFLHGMTFAFLGMFVAASCGEILFNAQEADILLHRPVAPAALLQAKIAVLVQVSLWLGLAFNLAGLVTGTLGRHGSWIFPLAHILSTTLEALFATASVVVTYQLCLRWFGRERLDGLMTTAQVLLSMFAVLAGQILPRLLPQVGALTDLSSYPWWIALLPPAWFAGIDEALAGTHTVHAWLEAALAVIATAVLIWAALGKLAKDYELGLQALEVRAPLKPARRAGRRWPELIASTPPISWWLTEPSVRASFVLCLAYMLRDRDVKLRLYPGLAPMVGVPVLSLVGNRGHVGPTFAIAFAGGLFGTIPVLGVNILRFSQQWQAADVFRMVPLPGPAPLCTGARRAVVFLLTVPLFAATALATWLLTHHAASVALLLPGVIALPLLALAPCVSGKAVPLSHPIEAARSARGGGLTMMVAVMASLSLSGLTLWAHSQGWFWSLLLVETILVAVLYAALRRQSESAAWGRTE